MWPTVPSTSRLDQRLAIVQYQLGPRPAAVLMRQHAVRRVSGEVAVPHLKAQEVVDEIWEREDPAMAADRMVARRVPYPLGTHATCTRVVPRAVRRKASPWPASASAPGSSMMIRLSVAFFTRSAS